MAYRWVPFGVKFSVDFIKMGAFWGEIFCTFQKSGYIFRQKMYVHTVTNFFPSLA